MQRHILNKRKASCTHISPRVTLQMLKKEFVKGEALRILRKNSSETIFAENNSNLKKKTLDGRRLPTTLVRGTQRQFSENICSKDDLRSRIFGTFVVKLLACLPLSRIFEHLKNRYNCPFLTDFYPKKVT